MLDSNSAEQLRITARVARLYHTQSMRQTEIARLLGVSQARVSRILSAAEEQGIIKTIVIPPAGLYPDLEQQLADIYKLKQVHIVSGTDASATEPSRELGRALASVLEVMPLDGQIIGFTPWSRSLREMARDFRPAVKTMAATVVELMGGVGPPRVQHEATVATDLFAKTTGSKPMFLRAPSVVQNPVLAHEILKNDPHASKAIALMDSLDVALLGLGTCEIVPPMEPGDNFFSEQQFELARANGAVGQINLRFFDAEGNPVITELDELVIGITLQQMLNTPIRVGVAGGGSKREALYAALRGGYLNVLITDQYDAEYLIRRASGKSKNQKSEAAGEPVEALVR